MVDQFRLYDKDVSLMKRIQIFFLIAFCFLTINKLSAKILDDFGINAGMNYSSIGIVNYQLWADYEFDLHCGGYIELIDISFLAMQLGVNYSQMSFTESYYALNQPITRLKFIQIPVLLKIKHPNIHLFPYLIAGYSYNFLISPNQNEYSEKYTPTSQRLKDNDITTILGIGICTTDIFKIPSFFELQLDFSPKSNVGKEYIYSSRIWGVYFKEYQTYYNYSFKFDFGIILSDLIFGD